MKISDELLRKILKLQIKYNGLIYGKFFSLQEESKIRNEILRLRGLRVVAQLVESASDKREVEGATPSHSTKGD